MAAHQAPPSLGFSRQEHWSGLPFPSPVHGSKKRKWSGSFSFCLQCFPALGSSLVNWLLHQVARVLELQYSGHPVQFSSVAQSCPTFWDPMDCSTPGLPVHHQLLEFIQTHVHWVGDAIQPSHSLWSRSSRLQPFPASGSFQMSHLFASGGQRIGVSASASVLPMNTQDWSPLGWTDWISLQSKGLSRVFSNTAVQKHQFFGAVWSGHPVWRLYFQKQGEAIKRFVMRPVRRWHMSSSQARAPMMAGTRGPCCLLFLSSLCHTPRSLGTGCEKGQDLISPCKSPLLHTPSLSVKLPALQCSSFKGRITQNLT